MGRLKFINSVGWKNVYARSFEKNSNGEVTTCLDDEMAFCFDCKKYDRACFENELGERTETVHPGSLSLDIDYKYNENIGRMSTYICGEKKTGKIDSFILYDEKNLSHRDDRSKQIHIFVPYHYDGSEPYDLLYFFDAQNLFCKSGKYTKNGDPYGSWQLDQVLDSLYCRYGQKIIVVGIDNADKYRDQELFMERERFGELTPLAYMEPREDYSHGYLDGLSDFMIETLHKYVIKKYNVKTDNIGIGGSSMGGLAAFYCGMRDLGFYKYIISYSPAYGLYGAESYAKLFNALNFADNMEKLPYIHIYCGGGDDLERLLLPSAKEMRSTLYRSGYDAYKIFESYDKDKAHNEESWRMMLGESLSLLLHLE